MKKFLSPSSLTKAFVTFGIAALLLLRLDWAGVAKMTESLHATAWIGALAVMSVQILLLAGRWTALCDEKTITYPRSLTITLAALLSNFLLITSISGVFVRIGLSTRYGMAWIKASCAAVVDRLLTLIALVILAAFLMPNLDRFVEPQVHKIIIITLGVFVALSGILIPIFFGKKLQTLLSSNDKIKAVTNYLRALLTNPMQTLRVVGLSLAAQIVYFVAVYAITKSTGANVSFAQLLTVLPVITLVASLPLSLGGWGIREGAFVYGLGLLGVPMETAFLVSVQIGLLSMLSVAVTALPVLGFSTEGRDLMLRRTVATK
jgi:uncharacterized membrane protein YbhN (UPF0104 family)